ncbi:MAG TPA: N-acetyltransferase [Acidobacteriaceae bacterium]|nr:N-acetyltransferase [Acidobacteriaceae bacterium]
MRRFETQDLAGLHQLDQVCFSRNIAYSRAELRFFLARPGCSCWIAEHPENKLAGFVILERESRDRQSIGHIITLDVDPAARRRGLGTLLMHAVEEQLKQEGIRLIRLEVAETNTVARQFYRGLGFVTRGRIAKYYGGRIDAEVMEKTLSL